MSSAAKFAQSALRARLDSDSMVYLLHASTGLELLAKGYLASLHGSLIAAGDFDSLLHGCGQSKHARTTPSRMRTITMTETLKRVGQILPTIDNMKASLQLLADVRNGVAHAGKLDPEADDATLVPFIRACDHLLSNLPGGDRASMWGEFISLVDARLSDSTKAAELLVADALAAARLAFDARFGSLDDAVRDGVLSGIENSYDLAKYEESIVDCPACARSALTRGSYEVDWEADWDVEGGEGYVSGVYPVVTYSPGYLYCRVCGLELDGQEQLSAAGVADSWTLEDADAADFYDADDWR
jgi:hypothetical protein